MLNIDGLSRKYQVKRLSIADTEEIYALCRSNPLYYEHCPPMVTRKSILDDMTALPPNISPEDKYYLGFYHDGKLLGVLDLIDGYPEENIAFIGFFMTDAESQGKGIASALMEEISGCLKKASFLSIRLAWVKGNPQAEHFWLKNGFLPIKETASTDGLKVMLAEKVLGAAPDRA